MTAVEADLSVSLPEALSESPVKPKRARKPAAFALKALEPLEAAIQNQILDYLRVEQARGRVVWFARVNGTTAKIKGYPVKSYRLYLLGEAECSKGYSDLHGMLPGGKYFALEVKSPGGSVTPEQLTFIRAVSGGGGIAAAVRHWEDVKSLLWGEVDPARDQRCYADQYAGVGA